MARGAPFPHDPAEFDSDERISYSRADEKYLLVDDDGEEWEFNPATGKWHQPVSQPTRVIALRRQGGVTEPSRLLCADPIP
jgi:HIV Tat-specific factor 1